MRRALGSAWGEVILAAALVLGGCADDAPTTNASGNNAAANNSTSNNAPVNNAPGNNAPDNNSPDNSGQPPAPGAYGAPCDADAACDSRLCVRDREGGICSDYCLDRCARFFPGREGFCRADSTREGAPAFLCFPSQDLLCVACVDDTQCDGAPCLETSDGRRCGLVCEDDAGCPAGFSCDAAQGSCVPDNGSCSCGPVNAGERRPCAVSNASGRCVGEETCDPASGWTGCDAPQASAEVCDGQDNNCNGVPDDGIAAGPCVIESAFGRCAGTEICDPELGAPRCVGPEAAAEVCDAVDNDCDGAIDEDFKSNSNELYTDFNHCGACNQSCEGRIPFAATLQCITDEDGAPRCAATACAPGYALSAGACIPLQEVVCQPCADDAECEARSPGARCVTLGDPTAPETQARVCGRDCSAASPYGAECPDGYTCQVVEGGADQCLPAGGSCLCLDNDAGFAVACTVENEALGLSCQGFRACEGDTFGACQLPAEVCDGVDNECDGVVDNGFRDPATGRYDQDPAHCGRCNRDCGDLSFTNAVGTCDLDAPTPLCVMTCLPGFLDLFNGADDGCECAILSETDTPDGVDRNCDRIDGDASRAVFVSKRGRPDGAGTLLDPINSIQRAITQVAASPQLRDVYVATGVYSENLTLQPGVNVYGGYSLDFLSRDLERNPTTLLGVVPSGAERGTITARDIRQLTVLDGFSIYGRSASTPGASSYTVYLQDADDSLRISHSTLFAGDGADGARGGAGRDGAGASGAGSPLHGVTGLGAVNSNQRTCTLAARAGGLGGRNTCGGQVVHGGNGGNASCPQTQRIGGALGCVASNPGDCRNSCLEAPCSPLPPAQGAGAAGQGPSPSAGGGPTYDRWTSSGQCTICGLFPALDHIGNPGANGADGGAGSAGGGCSAAAGSVDAQGLWRAGAGNAGGDGGAGSGGGGGSAGSGFWISSDASGGTCQATLGGSGGGGGAGGCGGAAGTSGGGGGGSFAVFLYYTTPSPTLPLLRDNIIQPGLGGRGGNGGPGGVGGPGGLGASGGLDDTSVAFCAEPGGRGGNGGRGGGGGGGGGGCGGVSAGVYLHRGPNAALSADPYRSENTFVAAGAAGAGGTGGVSAAANGSGAPGAAGVSGDIVNR